MTASKAPDGLPWPTPRIAVDTREQRPWTFGHHPLDHDDRALVHSARVDPYSLVTLELGGPFHVARASLRAGDYWLLGPDGPLDGVVVIERKEADLEASLTWDHARLERECQLLAGFQRRTLVLATTLQDVIAHRKSRGGRSSARSVVGSLIAFSSRHNIPVFGLPDRAQAEYFAAWILRDAWRAWVGSAPERLAWARDADVREESERARAGATPPRSAPAPPGRCPAPTSRGGQRGRAGSLHVLPTSSRSSSGGSGS